MNRKTSQKPLTYQRGAALVVALVAVTAVGGVAAGTSVLLQQNTQTSGEEVRMMQGTSIADSFRLAIFAGRNADNVRDDLEETMYAEGNTLLSSDGSAHSGSTEAGGSRYGYEFIVGGSGDGSDEGAGSGALDWEDPLATNFCEVTNTHGASGKKTITCTWSEHATVENSWRFTDDDELTVIFDLGNSNDVRFKSIVIVDGELDIRGQGNSGQLCFEESVGITGDFKPAPYHARGGDGTTSCDSFDGSKTSVFEKFLAVGDLKGNENDVVYSDQLSEVEIGGGNTLADALNDTMVSNWSINRTASATD
ncbi:hypothetical protein GJ672_04115 [Spiribacter sp. 2438]|uniref:hypothetical protein n=1 Tax=Spiribacter sp. 2438 TaxID=2666185 RepID=UPI0012AFEB09|nr:hypothetical protein [Spiribacter sp. 2438]QGM21533.1 hypothetical protein GJ672_04115 [Spiribacter sp. 2438]